MDIPVSLSPFFIALSIGVGPLYFGSKDGCIFIIPGVNKSI